MRDAIAEARAISHAGVGLNPEYADALFGRIAELEAEVAEMKARLSSIPRGHAGKSEDDIIVGSCLRRGCPQARNEGQE